MSYYYYTNFIKKITSLVSVHEFFVPFFLPFVHRRRANIDENGWNNCEHCTLPRFLRASRSLLCMWNVEAFRDRARLAARKVVHTSSLLHYKQSPMKI